MLNLSTSRPSRMVFEHLRDCSHLEDFVNGFPLMFPIFRLSSLFFSKTLKTHLYYHILQLQTSFDVCTHPINLMSIHFLCCTHDNECIGTHDEVPNTFVAIMRDVGFHVGKK
jgi:hypothetical protein